MRIGKLKARKTALPLILFFISNLFFFQIDSSAQKTSVRHNPGSTLRPGFRRDPEIMRMLREIDSRNIERTIRKLVSFGTRNTLSEQNDPKRGIGAARDWLYGEFLKVAQQSGGRMTVEK